MNLFATPSLDKIDKATELAIVRRAYAKHLLARATTVEPRLEAAFATVPREHFLGPGPWRQFVGISTYRPTPNDDPVYVYADNFFELIAERGINNGQPMVHVSLLARAGVKPGEHLVHVGAGTGYYTAILAHLTGPTGRVTAIEVHPDLAVRATSNLTSISNVSVLSGDAFTTPFDPADVIYVNAGVARVPIKWVDRLRDGGRLILPMTSRVAYQRIQAGAADVAKLLAMQQGFFVFRIERVGDEFHVTPTIPAAFIPAQDVDEASDVALSAAFEKGGVGKVKRLYRRDDLPDEQCWLKGEGWCLAYE